jgi:large subunit ribosomal protein L4e
MKASILEMDGKTSKKVDLPQIFDTPLRSDLVRRAFWLLHSHSIQPKGRDPMAGMKTSAETYNPPTGRGVARVPRVKGERHPRSGQAAGIASVVKGRTTHKPRAEKVVYLKINRKERRLALASAIAFTGSEESVLARGHRAKRLGLPLVVSDDVESIGKTAELLTLFEKLKLTEEVERLYDGIKRISGKARLRGRTSRERTGPLIVVTNDRGVGRAAESIPGVEVATASSLNVLQLAPGGVPGRLTLWTESALTALPVVGG